MSDPDSPGRPQYSVCQFFANDTYEYVARWVVAAEAFRLAEAAATSVGALVGTTRRVIITDGGDETVFEWQYGAGLVWPPREMVEEELRRRNP